MTEVDSLVAVYNPSPPLTNTPIDECLNIIRDRLDKDQDLKNRTLLNVDDIMELMKFILTTKYFTFQKSR